MNRIFFLAVATIITCFLTSCKDDSFVEGRITTFEASEITNNTAVLRGNIEFNISGGNSKIVRRGFVYGRNSHELNAVTSNPSGMVFDAIESSGNFLGNINELTSNTKYYAKTFFVLVQSNMKGRVVYNDNLGRLVYLRDGDNLNDSRSVWRNVFVFYGNTIEFTTTNEPE